jgi:hypothetical protein
VHWLLYLQRSVAEWESTFENCFELFGGTTATEELEELSSECAHICNSARAKLQQQQQQRDQIDAMLTKLVPLFDPTALLQQQEDKDSAAPAAAAAAGEGDDDEAMHDALDALYCPVIALCNKGKKKAAQLQQAAAEAVAAAGATAATAAIPQQPPADEDADTAGAAAGSSGAQQQQQGAGKGEPQQQQQEQCVREVCVELQEALQGVRSAAVKSLAEVAAGQIMVLLTMARSVAALPR